MVSSTNKKSATKIQRTVTILAVFLETFFLRKTIIIIPGRTTLNTFAKYLNVINPNFLGKLVAYSLIKSLLSKPVYSKSVIPKIVL